MIETHRNKLLDIDAELIGLLAKRMKVSREIGRIKLERSIEIEQKEFWDESSAIRRKLSESLHLSPAFIGELFSIIQSESIRVQEILTAEPAND